MTPESALKKAITDWLTSRGQFFLRLNSGVIKKGSRFIHLCPEGTADIVVFQGLDTYWIETKAPKGRTHKERAAKQAAFRDTVLKQGHFHRYCTTLEEAQDFIP